MDEVIKKPAPIHTMLTGERLAYYDTFIRGNHVYLRIGHQTFRMAGDYDEGHESKQAQWHKQQLDKAISNLTDHLICKPITNV